MALLSNFKQSKAKQKSNKPKIFSALDPQMVSVTLCIFRGDIVYRGKALLYWSYGFLPCLGIDV
jgi:hypothetical protein